MSVIQNKKSDANSIMSKINYLKSVIHFEYEKNGVPYVFLKDQSGDYVKYSKAPKSLYQKKRAEALKSAKAKKAPIVIYVTVKVPVIITYKKDKKSRKYNLSEVTSQVHSRKDFQTHTFKITNPKNIDHAVDNKINEEYPQDYSAYKVEVDETQKVEHYTISEGEMKSILKKPGNIYMFGVNKVSYYFIKDNKTCLKNENQCVYDAITYLYGFTKEYQMCIYNEYLQAHYEEIDEMDRKPLSYEDGVTSNMLLYLCKKRDITCYGLSFDDVLVVRNVSKSRNHKSLCWFVANSHMYLITELSEIKSIHKRHNQSNTFTRSTLFDCSVEVETARATKFKANKIKENINVKDLINHKNINIIYPVSDLSKMFLEIYQEYNFIPQAVGESTYMRYIILNTGPFQGKNIDLCIDPNHAVGITYKETQKICKRMNIVFNNQAPGALAAQIKDIVLGSTKSKIRFSKKIKADVIEKQKSLCAMCNKKDKFFHIEHIFSIAQGGSNEIDNIQALCPSCHRTKNESNKDLKDYIKIDPIQSSYNKLTRQIFDSREIQKWAFIEKEASCDLGMKAFSIDLNKNRKNILYYSSYDLPVYTVMDQPRVFKHILDKIECGFYYVDNHDSFMPLRGNGWYSQPMIEYCLGKGIIKIQDITHKLLPSLVLPAGYFKDYIDYIYKYVSDDQDLNTLIKLIVNAFIGACNTNTSTKTTSHYTTDLLDASYLCLTQNYDPLFLSSETDGEGAPTIYKCNKTTTTIRDEDARSIYLQVMDEEAIELHKLKCLIEANNGKVLEFNTDCITATFTNNKPMDITKYYWDDKQEVRKYKLEDTHFLKVERKPKFTRNTLYTIPITKQNIIEDPKSNDFDKLVDQIIGMPGGIHIDGCAGTGKTHLIKLIKTKLEEDKNVVCLAPTNKAARLLNGKTIHKWVSENKSVMNKYLNTVDYIIVDEISMIPELFYKLFITVKRTNPDIKFIMSGDFRQLQPVNDRVDCEDYKNSYALKEICNFNMLQLSECRRSDREVYEISQDTRSIMTSAFGHNIGIINVCYLNATRHRVNQQCMTAYLKQRHIAKLRTNIMIGQGEGKYDITLARGMPIICLVNSADHEIVNNEMFVISDIDRIKQIITLKNDEEETKDFTVKEFMNMFDLAFCITAHKSQGATFEEPYCIFDWDRMPVEAQYVAFTRGTKLSNINFC